jgi:hypothetical protein
MSAQRMDSIIAVARCQVLFRQHPAENSMSGCSNSLFFVACLNLWVNVGPATEGGIPMSLLPVGSVPRGQRGQRKDRLARGLRGTFQGEQRPAETDPSQNNRWRLR